MPHISKVNTEPVIPGLASPTKAGVALKPRTPLGGLQGIADGDGGCISLFGIGAAPASWMTHGGRRTAAASTHARSKPCTWTATVEGAPGRSDCPGCISWGRIPAVLEEREVCGVRVAMVGGVGAQKCDPSLPQEPA